MHIIDAHTHIYENGLHGSVDQLLVQMHETSTEKSIVIALPDICSNNWLLAECEYHSGKIFAIVFPDFSQQTWEMDLESNFSHKCCVGMKIHPRSQEIELNDHRVERALEIAEQYDMPVEVDIFPWGSRLNSPSLSPFALHPLAQKFPKTKFIVAHCGAPQLIETMLLAKSNKNIYIDVSFFLEYFNGFSIIRDLLPLCKKVGYGRFIYGSDFPAYTLKQYFTVMQGVFKNIPHGDWEKLTYLNSKEIFNL